MALKKQTVSIKIKPAEFSARLLNWHQLHGRNNLPWQFQSAYPVWLSEIMLQQTQVNTVIPYYTRFLQRFPDINSLANASIDEVLVHWQGLGYYARSRNLLKSAQIIRDQYDGEFPANMDQVLALPGIGRSTAGAILTFSCQQSWPILDGNVKRVLARCFQVRGWYGQTKTAKQLWSISEQLTPQQDTARYNQAMMDLGSSVCIRNNPLCNSCPLINDCLSYQQQTQHLFPEKKPKKQNPLKHTVMLLHRFEDSILLYRRPLSGIWGGLWSLPEVEQVDQVSTWQQANYLPDLVANSFEEKLLRHKFTHFNLDISVAKFELKKLPERIADAVNWRWVPVSDLAEYGLPTPVRKILNNLLRVVAS